MEQFKGFCFVLFVFIVVQTIRYFHATKNPEMPKDIKKRILSRMFFGEKRTELEKKQYKKGAMEALWLVGIIFSLMPFVMGIIVIVFSIIGFFTGEINNILQLVIMLCFGLLMIIPSWLLALYCLRQGRKCSTI